MTATSPERIPAVRQLRRPELLAPAGDWDCARAAVENGADAIYFGLERFNARMRAHNFTVSDLPDLMSFLHRRGVRGYVTFNTLVFQNEIESAAEYLKSIIASGVDAAIVQDIGICRLIRKLSPDFPIHASTQMTISSHAGIEFARELGCQLVVLARECSIRDIESIQQVQFEANGHSSETASALPLEVFVHGALCVAYSGQCLTSEALGGRSANRGECAQACRMPYELLSDGNQVDLDGRQYLLSPQDLSGMEVLPGLIRSGVASLKIEGRLKAPEYVAGITRAYRQAIDNVMNELEKETGKADTKAAELFDAHRYDLEMTFSRGLFTGWFRGNDNQKLAHARFGRKRGVLLGEVVRVDRNRVILRAVADMKPGDGVVFDRGNPEEPEEGGRIYQVDHLPGRNAKQANGESKVALAFGHGAIQLHRVQPGNQVWKTSDPEMEKRIRQSYEGDAIRFQRPIDIEVHGRAGGPMTLIVRDELGHSVQTESEVLLQPAEKTPLTTERLEQQLGRLGGTPFRLKSLRNELDSNLILPVSELNRLRRTAVQRLEQLRMEPKRWTFGKHSPSLTVECGNEASLPIDLDSNSQLVVLCRSMEQLQPVLEAGIRQIYCDFENPKHYRDAVDQVRKHNGVEIFVAPPRIFKPGEDWILKQVRSSHASGYLVRNYDHLRFFNEDRKIGDFSLNIANSFSADYLKTRFNLERLTASYDLNIGQLEALLQSVPPSWFEVTLHQHMPMFHMEHCVFCAFMSNGKDYRDCGRPCEKHSVQLRDRVGMLHPLKADVGCRNTLFNARAQTGAEFFHRLRDLGVRRFRIEFVNENPAQVAETLGQYQSLSRGEISGDALWRKLKLQNQLGVTRGQMNQADAAHSESIL